MRHVKPHGKMTDRKSKTLFVRNLPFTASNQKLIETFEEVGPLKTAFVVADRDSGKCKGYGYVQFSMIEDAVKAKESITRCDGRKVIISFADAKKNQKKKQKKEGGDSPQENTKEECKLPEAAEPVQKNLQRTEPKNKIPKQKPLKRCRIILRNLPFKCKESHIRAHFEKYGAISEVAIPLKKGSLNRGFAFVQYTDLQAAQRAVAGMNAQEIMGRPVAVDWAVAKDRFIAGSQQEADKASEEKEKDSGVQDGESSNEESSVSEESDEEEEEAESDSTDSEESEEEEDDDEEEDDHEEDEENELDKDIEEENKREKVKMARKSDVEEGRTLFIRNVPFEVDEEEMEEAFQEFGDLVYVRLVMDKVTGQPKGTAFVQFVDKESAEQCLAKAQGSDKDGAIVVGGRRLVVAQAVSRTQAQNQKADVKEKKDSRNLFLAREGLIRAGTQAAAGVSQEDMKKRMKIELAKREKLKNANIFVSSTRLCIHNLPPKVDEKELKKVLRQTISESSLKITECRVMRDLARTNQAGVAKSLGYAFVNFSTHEHALKALRDLNNSTVFGDHRRPIVEFSLENRKALEAKQKRLEKSKAQAAKKQQEKEAGTSKPKKTKVQADRTQDHIAKSMHRGAPKGMPKRFGPKVRHKKREQPQLQAGKKQKKKQQKMNRPNRQPEPRMMKRKKRSDVTDSVDRLISKHQGKKSRWFES